MSIYPEHVKITRHDGQRGRHYTVEGVPELYDKKLANVTSILGMLNKPGINKWLVNSALGHMADIVANYLYSSGELPDREVLIAEAKSAPAGTRDQALHRGTVLHEQVEQLLTEGSMPEDSAAWPALLNFTDWYQSMLLEVVAVEQPVFSIEHEYGGTIDSLFQNDKGRYVICDVKSGSIYPEAGMQLAAYAIALDEAGYDIAEAYVVHPEAAKAGVKVKTVNLPHAKAMYHHTLALYKGYKPKLILED
jgi:hypothetical protein